MPLDLSNYWARNSRSTKRPRNQSVPLSRRVATVAIAFSPTILLYATHLDLAFTPRRLLEHGDTIPLLMAPWAYPITHAEAASRLIQAILFAVVVPNGSFLHLWLCSVIVGVIRTPLAFVLTRSVGWAWPALFSHHVLYETSAGWGPSLLVLLALDTKPQLPVWGISALAAALCWLECGPWTYGLAIVLTLVMRLGSALDLPRSAFRLAYVLHLASPRNSPSRSMSPLLPSYNDDADRLEKGLDDSAASSRTSSPRPMRRSKYTLAPILLSLLVLVPFTVFPRPFRLLSLKETTPTPLLNILMLSFPRPAGVDISKRLLSTTINSFAPHLSPSTMLSVFTHSTTHDAFTQVQDNYQASPYIVFHADTDTHINDTDGHYLHLAEAFRWAMTERPAEWVMLVEDDFPVCPGGWEVISTVVNMLERDRQSGLVRGGFIGTGGSGLIIHHTYLPLMILALRAYSAKDSAPSQASGVHVRAPDLVVQDCLLGRAHSLCERPQGKLIISSRLVLDHIGGMATTTEGKQLNSDKWRCGWRHPFHGDDAVEVVVV